MSSEKPEKPKKPKKADWPKIRPAIHKNGTAAWLVDARIDGKGERLFFKTRAEADTKAALLRVARKNEGDAAFSIPEDLRVEAGRCMERLAPYGKTLTEAVDYFLPYLERTAKPRAIEMLIEEAVSEKKRKGLEKPTIAEFDCRCGQFADAFPGRECGGITMEEIETWLLKFADPVSRNNSRKAVVNLYNYAVRQKYVPMNPAHAIHKVKEGDREIEILTPGQIEALLKNSDAEVLPFFAISAFAGIRPEEMLKLEWSDIKWKQNIIRIRDTVSNKTGARNVTIEPTLMAWLKPYKTATGKVCTPSWRRLFRETREKAKIEHWPADCLRHSFASYWLQRKRDAPALALEMGNSVAVILKRYAKPLDEPDDAAKFWAIMPPEAPEDGKIVSFAA